MQQRVFEALGTHWQLSVDTPTHLAESFWEELQMVLANFEQKYSRFISTSEVNAFRTATAGTYSISAGLAKLLQFAHKVRLATKGHFEPAIGTLLELAGYDAAYHFQPSSDISRWQVPYWLLHGRQLQLQGPIVFDLGGFAKGTAIDLVSQFLKNYNLPYFLVDGGGDMYASQKSDGSAWKVAIELPGKPGEAISTVELRTQALAVSDIFRRRWGVWHHLVDPTSKRPVNQVPGCAVLASTVQTADALTTALALVPESSRVLLARQFQVEYLLLDSRQKLHMSPGWPGTFFA